jgi:hypothetical protein
MSVLRIAWWGLGVLLAAAPIAASAGPVVTRPGHSTDGLTSVRYGNCSWRNGHRVCARVDNDGNSLLQERYMRPRDFRERDSNFDPDFNFNSRQQGGTRYQGSGQGSGRYQ